MSGDRKNKKRTNQGSEIYCRPWKKGAFGGCSASHVVAQMLAASSRINTDLGLSVIVGLQDSILTYLHSSSRDSSTVEELLSEGLLAALPTLLASSLPQILLQSAEIVGGAALWSYEMNTKVANDKKIVSALVAMLSNKNKDIARGACNAVMDLATTSIGREKLRDCRAIDQLFHLFCQVTSHNGQTEDADGNNLSRTSSMDCSFEMEDNEHLILIFDALTALVIDNSGNHLELVSKDLAFATLSCMKVLRARFHDQDQKQLLNSDCNYKDKMQNILNGKRCFVERMIFRLAVEQGVSDCSTYSVDTVKKSIFGGADACFEHFLQHHWECCPMIIRKTTKMESDNDIIASLIEETHNQNIDYILNQLLTGMVSCPPVTADNLDALDFLAEVEDGLGHSIIYGQDIRIIKSNMEEVNASFSKAIPGIKEQHFFRDLNSAVKGEIPKIVSLQDCKQAYKMGYTIAIRGMEFRSCKVAAIADALAMIFGQASVGANLYLTPPNSQGLAAHYDDHCVLVCQLAGNKKWIIIPPENVLPRLYEPLNAVHIAPDDVNNLEEILLTEGDILYIPRGFPHAAHTIFSDTCHYSNQKRDQRKNFDIYSNQKRDQRKKIDICSCSSGTKPNNTVRNTNMGEKRYGFDNFCSSEADCINESSYRTFPQSTENGPLPGCVDQSTNDGFSLHLTFGIEVELPFEWEGMMHIALHSWAQHQKWDDFVSNSNSEKKIFLAVQLLHIAIRNLGDSCSLLRKACTVATPYSCYISSKEWEAQFGLDANSDTVSCQKNPKALSCKEVFSNLIGIVARRCRFADAYRIVEASLNSLADDSLQWMKWLRHLSSEETNSSGQQSCDDPYKLLREIFKADQSDVLEYESAFLRVKSKFCLEVKFEEAQSGFAFLLRKYRRARKQFINGMLALHSK